MHVSSILLVLSVVLLAFAQTSSPGTGVTVYLLDSLGDDSSDCSGHGSLMRDTIRRFAPGVHFVYHSIVDVDCQDQTYLITAAFGNVSVELVNTPAVVSISAGFYVGDSLVLPAIQSILDRGVPIFAAAGNGGTADCYWPAIQSGVIAVQAVNSNESTQPFSNFCVRKNRTEVRWASTCDGTSVATAILAGRAAVGMQSNYVVPGVATCVAATKASGDWVFLGPILGGGLAAVICLVLYILYHLYLLHPFAAMCKALYAEYSYLFRVNLIPDGGSKA